MTDAPFPHDFESASRAVLTFLRDRLGFGLWMVTRTEGEDWIVLHAEDHGYDVSPGTVFRWADSFCYEMVQGHGPRVAPNSDDVPAYAAAPIGSQVPIKSYIGAPLQDQDGALFGTLCAIDPAPQPETLREEQQMIDLVAGLLSGILAAELQAVAETRRLERLEALAETDPLTGLHNRRAWDRVLESEEARCRRYGHSAAIVAIDLDGLKAVNDGDGHAAGDALLQRTAEALRAATREADLVARLGGDEFGVVSVECGRRAAEALVARIREELEDEGIAASLGLAVRSPTTTLEAAWQTADQLMYAEKHAA